MAKSGIAKDSNSRQTAIIVQRFSAASETATPVSDVLAVEEPLEIRLGIMENNRVRRHRAVSITMRTPGNDFELAAGFLFTEGILSSSGQISNIKHCGKGFNAGQNTVRVDLQPGTTIDFKKLERHFYTTSSCGVCGKSSLEALNNAAAKPVIERDIAQIPARTIHLLPEKLRRAQTIFDETGGLHAAALFDSGGKLLELREDVGRHNAVDKLIGSRFLAGETVLENKILFLSGRASFELLQKAVMAQIPIIAAIGAPSSLAVETARRFNITLIGFVREQRFNIYTGSGRIS